MNMFALLSQAVINLEEREICKEVRMLARDFSKLQSFWPVIVDQRRITSPKVEEVATMSPTALVAIVSTADLCAKMTRWFLLVSMLYTFKNTEKR